MMTGEGWGAGRVARNKVFSAAGAEEFLVCQAPWGLAKFGPR